MATNSAIEWTTHTFNPWSGCTKVSPGCQNCYAAVNYSVKMRGVVWGPQGNRIVKAESGWKEPLKWNKAAACNCEQVSQLEDHHPQCASKRRPRVFCASLADVFEDWQGPMLDAKGEELWQHGHELVCWEPLPAEYQSARAAPKRMISGWRMMGMQDVRNRLFSLIDATPNLDWLVLTKRPENIAKMMPPYSYHACVTGDCPHDSVKDCDSLAEQQYRDNLWLGVSVENQKAADERIPLLLQTPAAVRFLSIEPLLGPLRLFAYDQGNPPTMTIDDGRLHWVICGGESGPGARPMDIAWVRSIVEQCKAARVSCFVKQLGKHVLTPHTNTPEWLHDWFPIDKKGGDPQEWPADLRVREFPR